MKMNLDAVPRGGGKPWLRLMAQAASFSVSTGAGESEAIDLKNKTLAVDLRHAKQGWLAVNKGGGADFVELETADEWVGRPSKDHKPAVVTLVHCEDFPDAKTREFRSNSHAGLNIFGDMVKLALEEAGAGDTDALPPGKAPVFRIVSLKKVKAGAQTTTAAELKVAPVSKWIADDVFDVPNDEGHGEEPGAADDDW